MDKDALKIRNKQSQKEYPFLDLSEGEYVELEFRRAAICTVLIWIVVAFVAVLIFIIMAVFNSSGRNTDMLVGGYNEAMGFINLVGLVFYGVLVIAGLVTTRVFRGNVLYVTNKRAIQYEMTSLFSNSVNVIDLSSVEDVSFKQGGILQYIFGIGTLRMSTVGDETTYTFKYVYKPTGKEMTALTRLVSENKKRLHSPSESEKS